MLFSNTKVSKIDVISVYPFSVFLLCSDDDGHGIVCCFQLPSKGRLFRAMATLCRQKMLSAFSRIRTKKELPNVQPQPIKRLEDLDKKKSDIGASLHKLQQHN